MSEDKESERSLEPEIKRRLDKNSEDLTIPFNKVLNAILLHGINHFLFPLQKYYSELEVEDQPIKEEDYQQLLSDLKDRVESSFTAVQKMGQLEKKFEKRYHFGKFASLLERQTEFIKFIEELNKPREIETKEVKLKTTFTPKIVEKKSIQEKEESV